MSVEHDAASARAIAEVNRLIGQAAAASMGAGRTALIEVGSLAMLQEKVWVREEGTIPR